MYESHVCFPQEIRRSCDSTTYLNSDARFSIKHACDNVPEMKENTDPTVLFIEF